MNRALRAATLGVLLFSPVALSACSSGQVTQTATQERDKTGPMAQVGDITLRQVLLAYPSNGEYAEGDDAVLGMTIVNSGTEDDALIGITGSDFSDVFVSGSPSGKASTSSTASSSASGSATPTTSSSASSSSSSSSGQLDITIPAGGTVFLGQNSQTVTLSNLSRSLTAAQGIPLTLTFERAGDVDVQALVSNPGRELPRGDAFNFEESETPSTTSASNGG